MLTGPGFSDKPGFPHLFCQKRLTEHIIDFVCASVVEIFTLEVNFAPLRGLLSFFAANTALKACLRIR